MCGIAGAINFNNIKKQDIKYVDKFNKSISHRGPDASGIWNDENIVFGHTRLSIIDLAESSNQPMLSNDEDIVIVFNGEIYNHEEIKEEIKEDFIFKTDHSDTEVIINAYRKWGIKALDKFVGMFAIALYDKIKEKVFLIRDRVGEKPFYITTVNDTLYFSSENKAFFESGLLQKEFNDEAIYHYLTFMTIPAPQTFFQNVEKIEAGYFYELSSKGVEKNKYWDIADYLNKENNCSFDEAKEKTEELLEKSMKYRNVADVPISVALSGGLDSSLNLFYAKQNRNDEISTINISHEKTSKFDESVLAKRYSKEQNVKYIPKQITDDDFIEWVEEYLELSNDVPSGDPNNALVYGMSKLARDNSFKVMLVGEGGDEIGGYPVYNKLVKLDKILKLIPNLIKPFLKKLPLSFLKKETDIFSDNYVYARRFLSCFTEGEKNTFWKKEKNYNSYNTLKKYADEIRDDLDDSFLRKVLNIEYKVRLAEMLLPRVDYPSMAASIEARSPFMDHKLVEYSATVPWNIKMRNGGAKSIIKAIATDKLPEYIVNAPKVGFGQLLEPFLKTTLSEWFNNEIINDKNAPIYNYIKKDFLYNLYTKHTNTKTYGYQLWMVYSLNKWMIKHG